MPSTIVKKYNTEKIKTLLVFVFFVFTMVFHLMHSAMWGDEWVEYDFSQAPILTGELYQRIIFTFQPPLYNFIMHFWLMCSQSLVWFRAFNILIGTGAGIFLYLSLKKLYNSKTARIAMISLAVCYRWIYCVQECSEYCLMLFFLFGAIFFYIKACSEFTYRRLIGLCIFCVGAVYSQYGAVFVILPLLLLFYFLNMTDKSASGARKWGISIIYLASLLIFAIPLYVFFFRVQSEANGIATNALPFTWRMCKDIVSIIGQMAGYFFALDRNGAWLWILGLFAVVLIEASVYILYKGKADCIKKSLIVSFWITYILHYFLVQLHVYAMVQANVSAGFFERYSYFYIPIACIVIPIIMCELWNEVESVYIKNTIRAAAGAGVLCLFLSFYAMMGNWTKATDDGYAKIWMENRGWEDMTYLIGPASYSFRYYVSHADGYQEGYLNNTKTAVDFGDLPSRFWLWKLSWGNDYELAIEEAERLGYTIVDYSVQGSSDKLTFCYLTPED